MPKKRVAPAEDLNLVPIMNLVTILIPFLLMAVQFVSYAVIDSTLPAIGTASAAGEPPKDEPLNLSVFITDQGYTIAGSAAFLQPDDPPEPGKPAGPTIPCLTPQCSYRSMAQGGLGPVEAYDVPALRRILGKVKTEYPNEENVILVPESDIPYEVLVLTMDATREDPSAQSTQSGDAQCIGRCLFPFVVVAGGVQQ